MVPLSSLGSECRAMFLNRTAVGEGYKHSSVPYFSIKIPTSSQCEGVGTKKNFCGPPAPEQLILYLKNQGSINRFDPSKWSLWQRASVQLSSVCLDPNSCSPVSLGMDIKTSTKKSISKIVTWLFQAPSAPVSQQKYRNTFWIQKTLSCLPFLLRDC